MVSLGQMSSYGDNNYSNWLNNFWDYFDFKKLTGLLNSGGSGGNNNDDDDDDDDDDNGDDNGGNGEQSPIDSASVSFNVKIRDIKVDGIPSFQNIVDKCIFHSKDSFSPLCIRCELLDADGEVLAKGEVKEPKKSYKASDTIPIPVFPDPKVEDPYVIVPNDVQDVEGVNLVICGFKDKCPDDRDKGKCDERKKDHKKHYDDFDKYYKDNKNKFGKGDYSKHMKDYEN